MSKTKGQARDSRTSPARCSPFRILHEWDGKSHTLSYVVGGRVLAGTKWPEYQPGFPAWMSAVLGCKELAHQITQANAGPHAEERSGDGVQVDVGAQS